MSNSRDFGICDTCGTSLAARYTSFERLVERFAYDRTGNTPGEQATVTIIRMDMLGQYCDEKCAWPDAVLSLAERGLRHTGDGSGPIEPCARCGGPVDLTRPHVAYQLMDQTETRQPWLISIQPHSSETLAYVCPRCDGDLAADEMNVPESEDELQPLGGVLQEAKPVAAMTDKNEVTP